MSEGAERTSPFGQALKRVEDPRFITGQARYTGDLELPRLCHMAVARSPIAHGRILGVDTQAARRMPGVIGVFTGEEMAAAGFGGIPCAWAIPDSDLKLPEHPAIAVDRVRHVGDAVALVVAEDPYLARDAADAVVVEYEEVPAVTGSLEALADGAPQLHDDAPGNLAFRWTVSGGEVDRAFEEAEVVVRDRIVNQRLIPAAMEPRRVIARYDTAQDEVTLWVACQAPHIIRFLLSLVSGIPEHRIRVISPDVGGGFGSKIPHYPEDAMAVFASRAVGRPVKWTETRSENFQTTIHGRDQIQEVEIAGTRDGRILGLRAKTYANMGAYLSTAAPGVPTILHGLMLSGCYEIPAVHEEVLGVFTNTTPVDAYRGAGRPEMTFLVERMVDLLARELEMDPVELRRRNLIPPFEDGHDVATGITYDTGNYEGALARALEIAGYEDLRRRQEELPGEGRYLGIGLATYVEICGVGPSAVVGAVGFGGGLWESATIRFHPSGKVNVYLGTNPHGQGEATTFAQVVADQFGIPVEDVEVKYGDTDESPMGWGTYGSRTTAVGAGAVIGAVRKLRKKGRKIAAHLLEVAEADVTFEDGKFFPKGAPDLAKTIQEIALAANTAWNYPEGLEPGFEASGFFDPANFVYPFGTHVAVVEVDAETGEVELQRYIAVDDCGPRINPLLVEGQVHGGIVQGVGQTLWEGAAYDEDGNLVTSSFMDYALPHADQLPRLELDHTVTPTPVNPLGVKGVGETGTIASPVAVYNAVMDALAPLGVRSVEMPLTPEKIWRAVREAAE
ncbi:MAG: xanthine dehydrogenase family protein molybdopterin-binding subunit [Gemmatimonadota bacterium]